MCQSYVLAAPCLLRPCAVRRGSRLGRRRGVPSVKTSRRRSMSSWVVSRRVGVPAGWRPVGSASRSAAVVEPGPAGGGGGTWPRGWRSGGARVRRSFFWCVYWLPIVLAGTSGSRGYPTALIWAGAKSKSEHGDTGHAVC